MRRIGKRLWALTLALCMVLSLLTMTVRADGERLTIQVGSATAAPGEYVSIPVTVSGSNVGVSGMALKFTLKTGVQLVPGPSESDGIEEPDPFEMPDESVFANGVLVFSGDEKTASLRSDNNVTVDRDNQALLTLNVIAPETAGLYTISVAAKGNEASNIVDEDSEPVSTKFVAGTLTVEGTHTHTLEYVDEEPATCKDGHRAYYICETCHKCFSDADGQTEITESTIVEATNEHQWDGGTVTREPTLKIEGVKTYECTVCHTTKTESIPVLQYLLGDVDGNGKINAGDVQLLFKAVLKKVTLSDTQKAAGDVVRDGKNNASDVQRLFKYVLKKIKEL